jgi:hypothetical protein
MSGSSAVNLKAGRFGDPGGMAPAGPTKRDRPFTKAVRFMVFGCVAMPRHSRSRSARRCALQDPPLQSAPENRCPRRRPDAAHGFSVLAVDPQDAMRAAMKQLEQTKVFSRHSENRGATITFAQLYEAQLFAFGQERADANQEVIARCAAVVRRAAPDRLATHPPAHPQACEWACALTLPGPCCCCRRRLGGDKYDGLLRLRPDGEWRGVSIKFCSPVVFLVKAINQPGSGAKAAGSPARLAALDLSDARRLSRTFVVDLAAATDDQWVLVSGPDARIYVGRAKLLRRLQQEQQQPAGAAAPPEIEVVELPEEELQCLAKLPEYDDEADEQDSGGDNDEADEQVGAAGLAASALAPARGCCGLPHALA